ncbi:erythroid differentiation-related factor 1 [Balamuthia mandrillaris]
MHEELKLYHTEKEIPLAHLEEVQDQVNSGEYDEEFFEKQGLSGDTAFHQAIQTSSKHQTKKAKNHHCGRPKLNTPPHPSKQLAHQLNKWRKDVLASHSPSTKFKVIIYDNLPTHTSLMLDSLGQRQLLINLKLETVLVSGYKPHHFNHINKPQWCENGIFVAVWNKGQTQLQDDSSSITSSLLALKTWQPTSVVIPIKGPQAQKGQVADQANLSSSPVPPLNVYHYLLNTFMEPKDVVLAFNPTTAMRHFVALFPGSKATNFAEHAKLLETTVLDRNKVQKGKNTWKKKQKVLKEDLVPKNANDENDEVPKDSNQSEQENEELPKLTPKNQNKSKAQQNEKDKSKEVEEEEEKEEEEEREKKEEEEDTESKKNNNNSDEDFSDSDSNTSSQSTKSKKDKGKDKLDNEILSPPVLSISAPDLPFLVGTDASQNGVSAVLYQKTPDKQHHYIAFASRAINDAQCNYLAT